MLLYLLLATATAGTPGVGDTPAMTCIKTTIKANGRTTDSSVAASSGNPTADRSALHFVRIFRLERERGKAYEVQSGYALVETYENGAFGTSLFDYKGQLLESCSLPQLPGSGT